MAVQRIHIDEFLSMGNQYPILDVRSPAEYQHAHIPGAVSFPLFTDEERKVVGTAYKQQSRETAIKIGLDYFGPKMRKMVEEVETLVSSRYGPREETANSSKTILVHCWRGGMRSAAIAWLLDLYGFKVYSLIGGYKKFRHWVIDIYSKQYDLKILGGYTGSGKTYVLNALKENGEIVIDLEKIASHKGSAFGNIGMPKQPSQEMFENELSCVLFEICKAKQQTINNEQINKPIWLEDESQRIGDINIPMPFWKLMRESKIYFLEIPFEERLKHIIAEYGNLSRERMKNAIERIRKRLGPNETKMSLQFLDEENIEACFIILLKYYDKWYSKGLNNRDNLPSLLNKIECETVQANINATKILNAEKIVHG